MLDSKLKIQKQNSVRNRLLILLFILYYKILQSILIYYIHQSLLTGNSTQHNLNLSACTVLILLF